MTGDSRFALRPGPITDATAGDAAISAGDGGTVRRLAVILDGNRRWASREASPTHRAYQQGAAEVHRLLEWCEEAGTPYVTVWALLAEKPPGTDTRRSQNLSCRSSRRRAVRAKNSCAAAIALEYLRLRNRPIGVGGCTGASGLSLPCASLSAMKLTQMTVNDLLAQIGPAGGHMYLPGDLDPKILTDLLAGRYGVPRTVVLDGFADPTVDELNGAGLVAPLGGRAVTMRAWACGDQWVGIGAARDNDDIERPVLAIAHRQVLKPFAVAPGENAY